MRHDGATKQVGIPREGSPPETNDCHPGMGAIRYGSSTAMEFALNRGRSGR
jgi:hypothetical protein